MQQGLRRALVSAGGAKGSLSGSWGLEQPLNTYEVLMGCTERKMMEGVGKDSKERELLFSVSS